MNGGMEDRRQIFSGARKFSGRKIADTSAARGRTDGAIANCHEIILHFRKKKTQTNMSNIVKQSPPVLHERKRIVNCLADVCGFDVRRLPLHPDKCVLAGSSILCAVGKYDWQYGDLDFFTYDGDTHDQLLDSLRKLTCHSGSSIRCGVGQSQGRTAKWQVQWQV